MRPRHSASAGTGSNNLQIQILPLRILFLYQLNFPRPFPFLHLHFSVAALYFLVLSMMIFYASNLVYRQLTKHLSRPEDRKIQLKPNYMR